MALGAIIGLAASGLAAGAQKSAAAKSARAQQRIAASALRQQQEVYEQGRADLTPFTQAGQTGLPYLQAAAGGAGSPLYQLRLEESEKGVNRALAARGLYGSGTAIEALSANARRAAAEESEARWGRSLQLSELGLRGASALQGGAGNYQQAISNYAGMMGDAQAQKWLTQGQAGAGFAAGANQAIQGGLQNYYTQQAGGGGGGYFGQFGGVGTGAGSPIYNTPGVL